MESASLGLLSNEPEDILNINHVLKFANYIKKKGRQEEETRSDRSRSNFPSFEVFAHASGFYIQTN